MSVEGTVWCSYHEDAPITAGELINRIEYALRRGIPKTAHVVLEDGSLLFRWQEPLSDLEGRTHG